MEFCILGPLVVIGDDGAEVELPPGQRRAVLIYLLLHANQPVAVEQLVDEIWEGAPPATAEKIVQLHVSHLRRTLGPARIEGRPGGYTLHLRADELDVARAEALAEAASDWPPAERIEKLRGALALWRGPALADVRYQTFARNAGLRLEELRLSLQERLFDARLEAGESGELIPDLEAAVREHPLREHLRALLMIALYRSGRQAEALEAYRQGRGYLNEELGLEPGPELQQLQRAILDQDEHLAAPKQRRGETPARRVRAAAATAVGVVVAVVAAVVIWSLWPVSAPAHASANSALEIQGRNGRFERAVRLGSTPRALALRDGVLWAADFGDQTLTRVDLHTGSTVTVGLPARPTSLVATPHAVWVASNFSPTLTRLDTATAQPVGNVTLPATPDDVAADATDVWVVNQQSGTLVHVDPADGRVTTKLRHLRGPSSISYDGRFLWIAASFSKQLLRVDPKTLRVVHYPLTFAPETVSVGCGSVWLTDPGDNEVTQFDIRDHSAQTIAVGDNPIGVSVAGSDAWVANDLSHSAQEIDCATHVVVRTIRFGSNDIGAPRLSPTAIAATSGGAWIALQHF